MRIRSFPPPLRRVLAALPGILSRNVVLACGLATAAVCAGQHALADTATMATRPADNARTRPDTAGVAPPPADHPAGKTAAVILDGAFRLAAQHAPTSNARHFTATGTNVSALYLSQGATLQLRDPTITSGSQTSSRENSRFEGQNAALLATTRSRVTVDGGTIHTTGDGAHAAFAADPGSRIALERVGIHTQGAGAHGIGVVRGATVVLKDTAIRTDGLRGAALSIDDSDDTSGGSSGDSGGNSGGGNSGVSHGGGGHIVATGGTYGTTGARSPVLYSAGTLEVRDARMQADAAEGAVVEGANAVIVSDSILRGKTHAVRIYRRVSGDASALPGRFAMTGGTLSTDRDALFYVTDTHAVIELDHVRLEAPGGREAVLVEARADRWGAAGRNGGTVRLQTRHQILQGVVRADRLSEAQLVLLDDSHLIGRTTRTGVTLDAGSHWTLTSDSQVLALNEPAGTPPDAIPNIDSQGHLLHYDAHLADNAWLGGKRHALPGGGALLPDEKIR
ncbi:MAG: hypothetical protein ACRYHA_06880 [Janthinobacterium lividum]